MRLKNFVYTSYLVGCVSLILLTLIGISQFGGSRPVKDNTIRLLHPPNKTIQ